ncbi:MAG: 3-deoxy-manno-octulosonate cytidylyltransferase [Alphaproteobacteria bacterium]|nr:3-deoxy-manno-octulosonate cytidylyltransferase [Alphaproteobacteria bacterium]
MNIAIVIPARYGSQRFPGKPMVSLRGRSLLERVWRIAKSVRGVDGVYVATEDQRIVAHAEGFGAKVILTSERCENGTERVREAIQTLAQRPDAVINLQGDAVLTPPWVVQALVDAFHAEPGLPLVTAAMRLSQEQYAELLKLKTASPTSGTTVTFDRNGRALYFSKAVIPHLRGGNPTNPLPVYRHIGIYGYATDTLIQLATLPQTPLEAAEQLEQLRALENGIPIKVVVVDYQNRTHAAVDTPQDIPMIERIIDTEGELLAAEA